MAKTFAVNVAVHKSPAESVFFRAGDEVPDWALDKCGPHCFEVTEEDDVRFRDPQYEEDDPDTKFSTVNDLPPSIDPLVDNGEEEEEIDLDSMSKDELKELCAERGLATSGNKEELKQRILDDQDEDEE